MQRFHFLGIGFVILSLCAACGDDSNDDDDSDGKKTDAGGAGSAGGDSKDAAAPDDDAIEIAGDWHSEFGDEVIDAETWNGSKLVEFDNDDNVAITQYSKDDKYNPNKFAKQVWTEPTDDGFFYCTVEFMLDTLQEAQDSDKTADDSNPENGGCGDGDFPWTKLEPKVIERVARRVRWALLAQVVVFGHACAGDTHERSNDASASDTDAGGDAGERDTSELPYAAVVVSFEPGLHAGFGEEALPDVVLGPPMGKGTGRGGLDVLSLGTGGEIVVALLHTIVDRDGPDFIVFENAFWPGGDPSQVFAEPAEVSVSDDGGETWHAFPCDAAGDGEGHFAGCAGWTPTLNYDPFEVLPLDPERTGGDAFDLADVGVARANFVRIRDLSTEGEGNSAGFDLDAVGAVNAKPPQRID